MTDTIPISVIHHGAGHFTAASPHWARVADKHYGAGECLLIEPVHERSMKSHSHYFASLHESWANLPERMSEQFPTSEHLRKRALIETGYRDERSIVCASKAEAQRVAAFIKPMDDYSVIVARECTVIVFTAKSQSKRAMGSEFQPSKEAVLNWVSDRIMVERKQLDQARAA